VSLNDIKPWSSPLGGHIEIQHYRMNASETFVAGEPVAVNADGELTESADDAAAVDVIGIALAPASYKIGGSAVTKNPRTGAAYTTGDMVPVVIARDGQQFITSNFSAAGSAFGDASPALADLHDEVGLSLISGVWGVDQSASNNTCRIVDILDTNKNSIQDPRYSANTGVYVVFEIVTPQLRSAAAPAA
jgi:hypothetical protein